MSRLNQISDNIASKISSKLSPQMSFAGVGNINLPKASFRDTLKDLGIFKKADTSVQKNFKEAVKANEKRLEALNSSGGINKNINKTQSGSKSFYTVQNAEDGARLLNDGTPWPTEPHKANLGEGVYSWDNLEDAENYLKLKKRRTDVELNIYEFKVANKDLAKMKSLDMTKLPDDEVDAFLDIHAKLNGGTPNHGLEYIRRATNIGVENYFHSSVFKYLKFTKK